MAITGRKIVQDIQNLAASGEPSINFRISQRQIFLWVNEIRSMLIGQSIKRRDDISNLWIQPIPCLDLALVDSSECPDTPIGCYTLKSTQKLPQALEVDGVDWIMTVTGLDDNVITRTNQFRYKYKKFSKFTGKTTGWYLKNGYIFVINDTLLSTIAVRGIWEDPSELSNFVNANNTPVWTLDSDYPISHTMANQITDIVLKTKVMPFLQMPKDTVNDDANVKYVDKRDI